MHRNQKEVTHGKTKFSELNGVELPPTPTPTHPGDWKATHNQQALSLRACIDYRRGLNGDYG